MSSAPLVDERTAVDAAASLHPETWLAWVFPGYVRATGTELPAEAEALFAAHHREFWAWMWEIEHGVRPIPFVGVWPRGGAKSTSAELGVCALGCTGRRRYGLYVCETQDQADDHVGNIGSMLESDGVDEFYPEMARRLVGKFGNSKGWRRNRLRTSTGFTVDAIGLDTASRGVKLEDQRPDFIVFDDIDHHGDSEHVVRRKIATLTKAILPAGSEDVAVLAIQNLVHRNGIFARLVDGRADFLLRRRVSGPIPAVQGLVTRHETAGDGTGRDVVIAGEPTWQGQDLATCQSNIDDWGLRAFLEEAQHDVNARVGALWLPAQLAATRVADQPDLAAVVVAVDPSGGDGPDNDAQGIIVAGRTPEKTLVVLDDLTDRLPPQGWARKAIDAWADWGADAIVAEINYAGAMVKSTVDLVATTMLQAGEITRLPTVLVVNASRGKRVRAEPVAALYGRTDDPATWSTGRAHHVGHFPDLEDEMTTTNFDALTRSPNRIDALVWAATHLLDLEGNRKRRRRSHA